MKRTFALLLALILLCGCLLLPVHAESSVGAVKLRLRSDVAGYACSDYSRFMEILSGNVIYNTRSAGPVYASDYGGTSDHGKLVAGRTYYVSYVVQAADGYALPDKIDDVDLSFDCGKGVSVMFAAVWFIDWRAGVVIVVVFLALMLTTRYMSLSVLCAAATAPVTMAVAGTEHIAVWILTTVSVLFMFWRHRENLRRLRQGTESKFSLRGHGSPPPKP